MLRRLRHMIEAGFILSAYWLVGLLPATTASGLGGAVARAIGPHLRLSDRARSNLARFMPELDAAAREATVRDMWENLGRTAAEYAHISELRSSGPGAQIEVVGAEHVRDAEARGKPVIFYTAHLANWEISGMVVANLGHPLHIVYREANNRYVETLFRAGRGRIAAGLIPKGKEGARLAMEALRRGEWLGMLLDQKMNDGMKVPFFGADAMTAPAAAALALRYDCTLIGSRVERLGGMRFRMTFHPPLAFAKTGDRVADQFAIMRDINADIERWIRARPGQWLWLHRRWPDS